MKNSVAVWRGWACAALAGCALLVLPLFAAAHGVDTPHHTASRGAALVADVVPLMPGCPHGVAVRGEGYRPHCHLSSIPAMAVGANPLRNLDRSVASGPMLPAFVAGEFHAVPKPISRFRIAAPPGYILFGNFRS